MSPSKRFDPPTTEDRPQRENDHHPVYEPPLDQCKHPYTPHLLFPARLCICLLTSSSVFVFWLCSSPWWFLPLPCTPHGSWQKTERCGRTWRSVARQHRPPLVTSWHYSLLMIGCWNVQLAVGFQLMLQWFIDQYWGKLQKYWTGNFPECMRMSQFTLVSLETSSLRVRSEMHLKAYIWCNQGRLQSHH